MNSVLIKLLRPQLQVFLKPSKCERCFQKLYCSKSPMFKTAQFKQTHKFKVCLSSNVQSRFNFQSSQQNENKALTIWRDLRQLPSSPKPALVLGFSGLLPFVCAPMYFIINNTYHHELAFVQLVYGATILSFLGGVRWGYVVNHDEHLNWFNMSYSVLPPLVAWLGLLFPFPLGVATMIGGLATSAYFDIILQGYPPWFKALRFTLSLFAVLSLWTTFMCKYMLKSSKEESKENELD